MRESPPVEGSKPLLIAVAATSSAAVGVVSLCRLSAATGVEEEDADGSRGGWRPGTVCAGG